MGRVSRIPCFPLFSIRRSKSIFRPQTIQILSRGHLFGHLQHFFERIRKSVVKIFLFGNIMVKRHLECSRFEALPDKNLKSNVILHSHFWRFSWRYLVIDWLSETNKHRAEGCDLLSVVYTTNTIFGLFSQTTHIYSYPNTYGMLNVGVVT